MPSKYIKLKDFPTHKENPFIEQAVEKLSVVKKTHFVRPTNSKVIQRVVSSDDQVTGYTSFMRVVEVDEDKFSKVYHAHLRAFWDLSKQGIRVFTYIASRLKPNQDAFYLIMDECKEYTGYTSERSVNEGIANLISTSMIARSNHHLKYYINPEIFFNGSRIVFAKMLVKKPTNINALPIKNTNELSPENDDVIFHTPKYEDENIKVWELENKHSENENLF